MTEKQKKQRTKRPRNITAEAPPEKPALRNILLVVWLLAGLYVGVASWTQINYVSLLTKADNARSQVNCDDPAYVWLEYDGDQFCVIEEIYAVQQLELMERFSLDWIFYLPAPTPLILSAFAFGVLGSLIRILRIWFNQKKLPDAKAASRLPVMGGVTAIMLLGVSYVFPSLFSDSNVLLKPEVQPFLSLFAGVFSEHLQKWFQVVMERNFNIIKKENE
jgi:hypothetical protein